MNEGKVPERVSASCQIESLGEIKIVTAQDSDGNSIEFERQTVRIKCREIGAINYSSPVGIPVHVIAEQGYKPGDSYLMRLKRGNLKTSTDGTAKKGDVVWDYWWNYMEPGEPNDALDSSWNPVRNFGEPAAPTAAPAESATVSSYKPATRWEFGAAKGNANNVAAVLMAAFIQNPTNQDGMLPGEGWINDAVRIHKTMSNMILEDDEAQDDVDTDDSENAG